MSTPRTIGDYGGIFADQVSVFDTTVQQSSIYDNRLHEDAAQMTRTALKARVRWTCSTTSGPIAVSSAVIFGASQMGVGSAQKPTISKTTTGVYVITYPTQWTDGLGSVEPILFDDGIATIRGATDGRARIVSVASNVVTVNVYDASGALSDLGGTGIVSLFLWS